MTTLLTVRVGQDNPRRCDAKCYDSQSPQCDCVCGGKNHGAGIDRAMENTRELAQSWIDRIATDRGIPSADVRHELGLKQQGVLL